MKTPDEHPDRGQLLAYAAGRSLATDIDALEAHLESCEQCAATIAATDSSTVLSERIARALRSDTRHGRDPLVGLERIVAVLDPSDEQDSLGRLGHYELVRMIGHGAFGIVFLARDQSLNRAVAIKVLSPDLASSAVARQRFLREARSAAAIRDDHVVRIHAVGEQPLPHLVMEYIPGETLQARLERTGPLEPLAVAEIGRQVARGLAAAHRLGLIHRDIKPSNVLIEESGPADASDASDTIAGSPAATLHARLTDFGLARATDETAAVTTERLVMGTPAYMSPEQVNAEPLDHRSDLFSLGSVLFTMCCGRPPFEAGSLAGVLRKAAECRVPRVDSINPAIPAPLCEVIAKLTARQVHERYQSAVDAAAALEGLSLQPAGLATREATPSRLVTDTGHNRVEPPRVAVRTTFAMGFLLLAVLSAVFIIRTNHSEFVLTTDDPAIAARLAASGGLVVENQATGKSYTLHPGPNRLPNGDYELIVTAPDGLELSTAKFQLRRLNGAIAATVIARPLPDDDAVPATDPVTAVPDESPWSEPQRVAFADGNAEGNNACISGDGLRIVFVSRRVGDSGNLFEAARPSLDEPFSAAVMIEDLHFEDGLTVGNTVGTPWQTADGLTMLLYSGRPDRKTGMDIWITHRDSLESPWGPLQVLPEAVSSNVTEYAPSMSGDATMLAIFRPNSNNPYNGDLWIAARETPTDEWDPAIRLGDSINTLESEQHPFLTANGLGVYFDRGTPDPRLWYSQRSTSGDPFETADPVLMPASWRDRNAYAPSITTDGRVLVFTSNVEPGKEGFNTGELWEMRRP